jgi:Flp pilus assembly protein TadG
VTTTTRLPRRLRRHLRRQCQLLRRRDERGAATVVVVFLALALLAGAGLVIDGGYALAGRRQAMNQAEQSARVTSDKLSEAGLRSGATRVDDGQARAAAQAYLASVGAGGTVTIAGGRVTVTVRDDYRPAILSMVGVDSIDIEATATAVSIDNDDTL